LICRALSKTLRKNINFLTNNRKEESAVLAERTKELGPRSSQISASIVSEENALC
jgi:hypothetical protein